MSEQNISLLTSVDRYCIIRKNVNNPNMSKKEINQEASIGKGQKREDIILTPWIKENMCLVFGEEIRLQDLSLKNSRDDPITPDIFGIDRAGCPIIIEVKFRFDFPSDRKNHLRTDVEYMALGQILQYSRHYIKKYSLTETPRLFIVSIDHSVEVDEVCKFLQKHGIDIKHIAIENILS